MIEIISAIKAAKSIAIFPHIMADGDAIGSSLALCKFLTDQGKKSVIIFEEDISYKYRFMLDTNLSYFIYPPNCNMRYDVHVSLDSGDLDMLGKRKELYEMADITVNIDHHKTNTLYGNINYVSQTAAATGEIIYEFIKNYDSEYEPDRNIAEYLYVAISTDTGGFRFSNVTRNTHIIAGELVDKNIEVENISKRVFEIMPKEQMKLLQCAISGVSYALDGRIGLIKITREHYEKANAQEEHSDGFINYVRNVEGVEVAVCLKEKSKEEIKVSLRSSKDLDVAEIAREFNGGGHERASGFTFFGTMVQAESKIIESLTRRMQK